MKITAAITLLALLVVFSGYFTNESFAEIAENHVYLLEGSGFAVTEESIKISELNIILSSQRQHGSTIDFLTNDGFITLDDKKFTVSNLEGDFLREGKYIRITGNAKSSGGLDTSISFFGRLVDESKDGSVYGFTGKVTTHEETLKIIYTTKLSIYSTSNKTPSEQPTETVKDVTIHIREGAALNEISRYFSDDRISIDPGTTVIIVNDDVMSHNIISGKQNDGDRNIPYTPDGRISTGEIPAGESASITFDELGFYRLYDPDYDWMGIVAYVFPTTNTDNLILGKGKNLGN